MTLLFGSILSGMQNCQNGKPVPVNPVGDDIWRARYDEFACFGLPPGATKMRMLGKPFHGGKDALRHPACCRGLILFDVSANLDEVSNGRLGPDYSHYGGGSSRFFPQERNQRAVFA